ncbi:Uncharacterised protein [uncultured archaeon]|nr:Uncharacterised protein [uncultured archaeon]
MGGRISDNRISERRKSDADNITMSNRDTSGSKDGRAPPEVPGTPVSYWIMPAVCSITTAVTSPGSVRLTISMHSINDAGHRYTKNNIKIIKILKMTRILGLIALISYIGVILAIWINANLGGYVYFSAGEPMLIIKYAEWGLGFIGLSVATSFLCRELRDKSGNDDTA